VPRWPLNAKNDIWDWITLHSKSLIDGCKSWHIRCKISWLCASMTLESKIWYMMVLCLDDPRMWNIIYDGFLSRLSFNANLIYVGFVPRCLLNEKYDIWCLCTSMTRECEIWYMMFCTLMTLDCEILYWAYMTINSINWNDDSW
jgi:hypothetical protein